MHVHRSLHVFTHQYVHLSMHFSMDLCSCIPMYLMCACFLSAYALHECPYVQIGPHVDVYPSIYTCSFRYMHLSLCAFMYLSVCVSVCMCVYICLHSGSLPVSGQAQDVAVAPPHGFEGRRMEVWGEARNGGGNDHKVTSNHKQQIKLPLFLSFLLILRGHKTVQGSHRTVPW